MRRSTVATALPRIGLTVATIALASCGDDGPVDLDPLDPLTRAEAIAAARAAYVDGQADDYFLVASMGPAPYPEGTRVREHLGEGHPPLETVLESDAYFVLVDRIPSAGLPHPFTYLFVDAETGEVTIEEAFYPPLIDGDPLYMTYDERVDPAHRFEPADLDAEHPPELGWVYEFEEDPFGAGVPLTPEEQSRVARADSRAGGQRVGVSIAGGRDSFIENTTSVFTDRIRTQGFDMERLNSRDHSLDEVRDRVRQRAAGLGEGDKFVLYLMIHSWVDDENDDGVLDGPPARLPYDLGHEHESGWPVFSTNQGSVADLLDDIPAEFVNLVIETCGGGGALINYLPNPRAGAPFTSHPGSTVRIYAGSAYNRVCKSSPSELSGDISIGRYTSLLLDYWTQNPLDADGNGDLGLEEVEEGFEAAQEHATDRFAEGELFSFDQMPPPVATFTGGTLQIDQPADGSTFPYGELVVFQGEGNDPQKGSLTFPELTWASDLDGVLGMGNVLPRNDLSPGIHTITLTGQFTGGVTVTRTISVTVGIGGVPQVSITTPQGGTFRRGDPIEFSGSASDPEDGMPSVLWTSDIDGDIGAGTEFVRSNLSEGTHTVTMEAVDSDGNVARATTQITVLTGIPEVTISSPENGTTVDEGTLVSFVGSALDPEDGVIPSDQLVWHSDIDSEICTGGGCLRSLSPGMHTITLTATDSDGNSASESIMVTVVPLLADLRPSSLMPDQAEVTLGGAFTLHVTVENEGNTAAPSGWGVAVFLSTDQLLDAGDVQVGGATGGAIPEGGSQAVEAQGTVPEDLQPGDYWWIVRVDPGGEVPESDEENNVTPSGEQVAVLPAPLVEVTPVEFDESHFVGLSPCDNPLGTITVTNLTDASVTVSLGWSLANEIELSSSEVTIPAGGSVEVGVAFTCSTTISFEGDIVLEAVRGERAQVLTVPVAVSVLHLGVILDHDTGPFAAGTFIALSRISSGPVSGPEAGCSSDHLHGTIQIDGMGPYADPDPPGCGHGVVTYGEP